MAEMNVELGDRTVFAKTVSESDVYLFAGITGDFSGNHLNEEFMKASAFGRRIAHGALIVGYMSTTSTLLIESCLRKGISSTPVSLGYDRVRFLKPVFIGDTIEVRYTVTDIDRETLRTRADIEVLNQRGEMVAVAQHLLKWVPRPLDAAQKAAAE
jgi:3-hydroxybutyryl-CoA dehydratase